MIKKQYMIIGGVVLGGVFAATMGVADTKTIMVEKKVPVVQVMSAKIEDQKIPLVFNANVESQKTSELSSVLSGTLLKKTFVQAGQQVKEGQLLAQVEEVSQQLTVNSADARIAKSKAQQLILQTQLNENKLQQEETKKQLDRMLAVKDLGSVSTEQIDSKQYALKSLIQKEANLKAQLVSANADVNITSNDKKDAIQKQHYAKITAPYDGVIVKQYLFEGASAGGQPVFRIESIAKQAKFTVNADTFGLLKQNGVQVLSLKNGQQSKILNSSVDKGQYFVTSEVPPSMWVGQAITLKAETTQRGIAVPVSLLKKDEKGWYLLGVKKDTVIKQPVQISEPIVGDNAIIITPIDSQVKLIKSGTDYLYENMKVLVRE